MNAVARLELAGHKNFNSAKQWLEKALEVSGENRGLRGMTLLNMSTLYKGVDEKKSEEALEEAIRAGNITAAERKAREAIESNAEPEVVVDALRVAAFLGSRASRLAYGERLIAGWPGQEPDVRYGLSHVAHSAASGYGPAVAFLADVFFYGRHGCGVDFPKALRLYTEAGEKGVAEGYINAGAMHMQGLGGPENPVEAFTLYQKALPHPRALRYLAALYRDPPKALPIRANEKLAKDYEEYADEIESDQAEGPKQ